MKLIPLTKGRFATVSNVDFKKVSRFNWNYCKNGNNEYALSFSGPKKARRTISMHRLVKGFPDSRVDHEDGNGLNNCRSNLRVATQSQNMANARKRNDNNSGFKGVSWKRPSRKWCAQINPGRVIHLGLFKSPTDAAVAYDQAAIKHFGAFAKTNKSLGLLCH
jgi:hypothetical protein